MASATGLSTEERAARAVALRAALAVEEALGDERLVWELSRVEREAMSGAEDVEQAVLDARAAWFSGREEARQVPVLEAELEEKMRVRVNALHARQRARHVAEARALYGRGAVGGGGVPRAGGERPPSTEDRVRSGERLSPSELDSYVQERLAQAAHSVSATIAGYRQKERQYGR